MISVVRSFPKRVPKLIMRLLGTFDEVVPGCKKDPALVCIRLLYRVRVFVEFRGNQMTLNICVFYGFRVCDLTKAFNDVLSILFSLPDIGALSSEGAAFNLDNVERSAHGHAE